MGLPNQPDAEIDKKENKMSYDFKNVPIAECFKLEFFAMICKRCGATHPFYVNHKGQPVFPWGLPDSAVAKFCQDNDLTLQDIIQNNCFVCSCGFPIRFPGVDEKERKADNKEKAAKLKRRGSGRRVISPKLSVVTEAQAKKILEAGEKATK
jgi:hypothetical protein